MLRHWLHYPSLSSVSLHAWRGNRLAHFPVTVLGVWHMVYRESVNGLEFSVSHPDGLSSQRFVLLTVFRGLAPCSSEETFWVQALQDGLVSLGNLLSLSARISPLQFWGCNFRHMSVVSAFMGPAILML